MAYVAFKATTVPATCLRGTAHPCLYVSSCESPPPPPHPAMGQTSRTCEAATREAAPYGAPCWATAIRMDARRTCCKLKFNRTQWACSIETGSLPLGRVGLEIIHESLRSSCEQVY